jgi:[ribosomal protein S5]-alanine N-acetyltransferase
MAQTLLETERLLLVPVSLPMVESVWFGRRGDLEALLDASVPAAWPGKALVERAFSVSLGEVQRDPERRLWGCRVLVSRATPKRMVGSIVFRGAPGPDGIVEIAYGIEEESQGNGYATEGTGATVGWALEQRAVGAVRAATPPWHQASRRVLEKIGMKPLASEAHDVFGEVLTYERRAPPR